MRFDFATAARIVFGPGSLREVAPATRSMGRRALVVTGSRPGRAATLVAGLTSAGVESTLFSVSGEPTVEMVTRGVERAREAGSDVVIAFGGGSPIDAAKAIAAVLANGGLPLDYLEVVGRGKAIERPSVPFIAVPTTAGTGSEVTRNAVLASPEHRVKASMRSPGMLARLAVIDPELTFSLPPEVTAATGLDALTQLIEPYVSARANAMTDVFCLDGIRRAARSLERAFEQGGDVEARTDMAMASLLGGLALANAGLGGAHGFAAPLGGMFPAPHGAACAALLPHVMDVNIRALAARGGAAALERYRTVARIVTGDPDAPPERGAEWVADLAARLRVPPLGAYGVTAADLPLLVEQAARASSMKANPIELTRAELLEIATRAL